MPRSRVSSRIRLAGELFALTAALGACGDDGGTVTPDGGVDPDPDFAVEGTTPSDGQDGVPIDTELSIRFNRGMSRIEGFIRVEPGPVLSAFDGLWNGPSTEVSFALPETLPGEAAVTVTAEGFVALDGSTLGAPFTFGFSTAADTVPPDVRASIPADGQRDVDPDTLEEVVITFDEPMDTSITQARVVLAGGATRPTPVSWDEGGRVATVPLADPFPYREEVGVDVSGLQDVAGNPADGAAGGDGIVGFFTGPDMFLPTVAGFDPDHQSRDVPIELREILFSFSEVMDVSATEFELVPEGGDPIPLTGTWDEEGLELRFPLPADALVFRTDYALDIRAVRDLGGNALEPFDPATGFEGVLQFRTASPSGEDCATFFEVADGITVGRQTFLRIPGDTFETPEEDRRTADGGGRSCSPGGAAPDVVFRYEKTSPSLGSGGRLLRVSARSELGDPLGLEIVASDVCAPAAERGAPSQLTCSSERRRWDRTLDVGPGTYWIFVYGEAPESLFPETVLVVDEVGADELVAVEGEACAAPLTETSVGFSRPRTGVRRWDLVRDGYHGRDLSPSWGPGVGAHRCVADVEFGRRSGPDAVIRFDKDEANTVLRVTADASQPVAIEVVTGACGEGDDDRDVLGCVSSAAVFEGAYGLTGPVYIWVTVPDWRVDFPQVGIEVEELGELGPGESCGTAIPVVAGDNAITPTATARVGAPTCVGSDANVTWYRYEPSDGAAVLVDADGSGRLVIVEGDTSGRFLSPCVAASAVEPVAAIPRGGVPVCIGVQEGATTTTLSISEVNYSGPGGVTEDVVLRGLDAGAPIGDPAYLATSGAFAWIGEGRPDGEILEVDLETGATTFRDDATDGLAAEVSSVDAVGVDGALFAVGDERALVAARVHRAWDGMADPWSPAAWDGSGIYRSNVEASDLVFDGDDFLFISFEVPFQIYAVPGGGGDPRRLTADYDFPTVARQLVADDTFVYLATGASGSSIARLARADLDDPAAVPTTIFQPSTPLLTSEMVLVPGDPAVLLLRATYGTVGGVYVLADPGGASPRFLGALGFTSPTDRGLAWDPDEARLAIYSRRPWGRRQPRIILVE